MVESVFYLDLRLLYVLLIKIDQCFLNSIELYCPGFKFLKTTFETERKREPLVET